MRYRVLIIDKAELVGAMSHVLLLNFKGEVELVSVVESLFLYAVCLHVERIVDSK